MVNNIGVVIFCTTICDNLIFLFHWSKTIYIEREEEGNRENNKLMWV